MNYIVPQAPLFLGFPRQEYWSGLPFLSTEDLPDPWIEPMSPALAGRFFTTEPPGKPKHYRDTFHQTTLLFLIFLLYFWLCWVFIFLHGFPLVAVSRGYSSLWCVGFSLRWLLWWSPGSRHTGFRSCSSWTLERGPSSRGAHA